MLYSFVEFCEKVSNFLYNFGFPTRVNGYQYLKDALVKINENPSLACKVLYIELAQKYKSDMEAVDRCFRTLVDKMWVRLCTEGLFSVRPSNREFIIKCVEYINKKHNPKSVYDVVFKY